MSSQRSNSGRYGKGTLSGSLGRGGGSGPGGSGPFTKGYGSGLVSLGTTKKPRTVSSLPERKLSVPKPVNLPSLRKENAGNDPNTQLVPPGGGGGWQKPEQKPEEPLSQEPAPNLTAGSSWASTPSTSGVPSWQPPQPFPVAAAVPPRTRSLNPHEYPSLSAAATARQNNATKQPVPHLPTAGSQGGGNWDEDERKPTSGPQGRSTGESWADSRFEDDEKPAFRPPWESNGRPEWRGPPSDGPYRAYGGEDNWTSRGAPSARSGYPPKPVYGAYDRFREVEDPTLFPPPPPPRHLPPPPPPPRIVEQTKEEAEAEKRAFEAEIDRVIEEERQKKWEMLEAARIQPPQEEEPDHMLEPAAESQAPIVPLPPPPPPPPALTEEQQAAAAEAARQKVIALRKQREAEAEEEERKRKGAAAAKLKELEERIARKKAEKMAKEKEVEWQPESAETAAGAAEAPAEAALKEIEEAAAEAVEASAEGAAEAARAAVLAPSQPDMPRSLSKDSLSAKGASSVEVEASSSVGQWETVADLDSLADRAGTEAASDSSSSAWKKPLAANQPRAIWQRRDREAAKGEAAPNHTQAAGNAVLPLPERDNASPHMSADESGASSLFAARSGFGPALVATSLGILPEELAAAHPPALSQSDSLKHPADSAVAPPTSGPMSWRAALGGVETTPEPADVELLKAEENARVQGLEAAGRGRGLRGRREKEQTPREDRPGSRGERGRGRLERGRGRSRGRQDAAARDDPAQSLPPGQAATADSQPPTPREGRKPQRQRGEGRGRGLKAEQSSDGGRGRGRGGRGVNRGAGGAGATAAGSMPPTASTSAAPLLSVPPGTVPAPPASKPVQPPPPPGISARVVLPPAETILQPQAPASQSKEADTWGLPTAKELPPISRLSLSKPTESLSPTLDPVAPMGGPDARSDRAFDRPIDRPKSAAGAVGRPRSATQDSLLPNGMPVLPNDLSLEGLAGEGSKGAQNSASITFGFQPSQGPSGLAPGPFPGVFFPSQHGSSNPWQPTGSSGQSKPNLEAAVQSFYKAGGPSLGSNAFSQPPGSQPPAPGLQFGAFGAHNFPQFGQLTSGFGQLPFIHTGKQPDWSTGPLSSAPASSGLKTADPAPGGAPGPGFSRSQGMDAIVPPSKIGKRGAQSAPGPPGPPGLQRPAGPGPQLFPAPGLSQHSQALQPPPPGLQVASQQPAPPQFSGSARGPAPFQADQPLHTNFGPLQPQFQQGPSPGISASGHPGPTTGRDQAAVLPDDVFETIDVKLTDPTMSQFPGAANGQVRRSSDGRGRGARAAAGRGQAPGRGRSFARNHAGRGMTPPPNLAGPLPGNLPFQQMPGGPPGVAPPPMHTFASCGAPAGVYNSMGHPPAQVQHEGLAGDPGGSQQGGPGPKREGRSGQHQGARGKGRGRGDRGRGQNTKFVYVAHGAGNGGADGAAAQAIGPTQ